ncbi:MAG: hypothetical protein K6T94_06310 [Paenibacillus sp.]|nr:hypothetical protein [Paenibacillus sp.]
MMKKVLTRIGLLLLILDIAAIIFFFYIDKFSYAYGLMLVLFIVFSGMGGIYRLRNDEYMFKKLNSRNDYEDYTR